jgi:hypothetical protein
VEPQLLSTRRAPQLGQSLAVKLAEDRDLPDHAIRAKKTGHVTCPCKAIMAASEASFWSLPQGGPIDFPSDAIVFRKLVAVVASTRSACSSNCFSGIPRNHFASCARNARV